MSNPTTPFGWQMPQNTDLVTDLPADFEVFGQAVATSMQDLLGGTTGQVLAKASNTDMDFVWSADAGMTNPMTTTGDVIYSSPGSTPVRLGIGTANQVLRVNSGATAPEWATPAAGGGLTLISETVASASSAIDFTSISGSYKQLLLVWAGVKHSATGSAFGLRLNADSASNYKNQGMYAVNVGFGTESDSKTSIFIGGNDYMPFGQNGFYAEAPTGYILIDNYSSTTKAKTYYGQWAYYDGTYTRVTPNFNGYYDSATAITQVNIFRATGSQTLTNNTNTTIRLYGVN